MDSPDVVPADRSIPRYASRYDGTGGSLEDGRRDAPFLRFAHPSLWRSQDADLRRDGGGEREVEGVGGAGEADVAAEVAAGVIVQRDARLSLVSL